MPTVKLRFPGGRYHATPWGHHVNEGLIEWPPSPWRLLRALIACGYSTQGWVEIPPVAQQLINKLAEVLPSYQLPSASAAHSRHYMPMGKLEKGREKPTLVFDTWANIGEGELFVHWPCELSAEEAKLLDRLASVLGYLGRSESWVEAHVIEDVAVNWNAVPCIENEHRGPDWEQISLMAAIPPDDYRRWQQQESDRALAPFPLPESKKKPPAKLIKSREKAIAPFPPDLITCLTKDTVWWKSHGWSHPPGSQRVLYWRKSDALQVGVPGHPKRLQPASVEFMLLALTTPTGNRSALPPVTRTLPAAEKFHQTVIGIAANGERIVCPELIGRDENGNILCNGHRHAHTIPLDLDGDCHIDHILIFAKSGLGPAAQQAILKSRKTWQKNGPDLQVSVVGSGNLQMLRHLPKSLGNRINMLLGQSDGSLIWESATPFVPPRFLKRHGKNTLEGQIQAELHSRGLPPAEKIEILNEKTKGLRHFIRSRQRGRVQPPLDIGYAVRLQLSTQICGPLALGYASHFGLGLFLSAEV